MTPARPLRPLLTQGILAHHTSPKEAGMVFAPANPKLAVYTHIVFLACKDVPPASVHDLIDQTRQSYIGPLEIGQDLMCIQSARRSRFCDIPST